MSTSAELQQRFGLDRVIRFETGNGGLTRVVVTTRSATAEVYLLGAHVTRFAPGGQEALFVSEKSHFAPGKAIRGGVPICWPWFGPRAGHPKSPMHGFARLREFEVESVARRGDDVEVVLKLESDAQTGAIWRGDFVLRHRITVGATLRMELETTNRAASPMQFEEALHTYFACRDIQTVGVSGLGGVQYLDKTDSMKQKTQEQPEIRFTAETDRVYLATRSTTTISGAGDRSVVIAKENSDATVVWNPWIAKAAAMPDFGDEEWRSMLCVETCNVGPHAVTLAAGATHRMAAILSVE